MAWLLDTNICAYAQKKNPALVLSRLKRTEPSEVRISVITVYELFTGCEKSSAKDRLIREVSQFLWPFSLLDFSEEHARRAATVRANLELRGTPIGPYDVLLAAQALSENLVLVTNNTREFQRVKGLRLQDWSSRKSRKRN